MTTFKLADKETSDFLFREKYINYAPMRKKVFSPKYFLNEQIDINKIKFCSWFLKTLSYYHKDPIQRKIYLKELNMLNKYLAVESIDHIDKKVLHKNVEFGFNNTSSAGRYYSNRNSFQNLTSTLRYLLVRESYFDLDLKTSHLSILYSYYNNLKIDRKPPLKILHLYIGQRDSMIDAAAIGFYEHLSNLPHGAQKIPQGIDLSIVAANISPVIKRKFIVISNRAKFSSNPKTSLESYLDATFCKLLFEDLDLIRRHMSLDKSELFVELRRYISTREYNNFSITLQNFFCYTVENQVIDLILNSKPLEGFKNNIPISDGVMIKKNIFANELERLAFCEQINEDLSHMFEGLTLVSSELKPKIKEVYDMDLNGLESFFNKELNEFDEKLRLSFNEGKGRVLFNKMSSELKHTENLLKRREIYKNFYNGIEEAFQISSIRKNVLLKYLCKIPEGVIDFNLKLF
jgi:hypothetical protein